MPIVVCCSVAKLCWTPCDLMDCRTPTFPVLHYLLEFAQTHFHWVSDAIQPCHPVIPFSSCLPSFSASGSFPRSRLFASGVQSIGASASASVHPKNIQGWFPLGLTGLSFLLSKELSRVFSNTKIWKDQFFGAQPSLWSNSHIHTWLEKTIALTIQTFVGKWYLCFLIHCLDLTWDNPLCLSISSIYKIWIIKRYLA